MDEETTAAVKQEEGEHCPVELFIVKQKHKLCDSILNEKRVFVPAPYEEFPENIGQRFSLLWATSYTRKTPGFCSLLYLFTRRVSNCGITFCAGALLGLIYAGRDAGSTYYPKALLCTMTMGLCSMQASLRPFGAEKTQYFRECSTSVGSISGQVAYFIGKNVADLITIASMPLSFLISVSG